MVSKNIQKVIDLIFIQKISVGKIIQKTWNSILIPKNGYPILNQKAWSTMLPCKFILKIDVVTHIPKIVVVTIVVVTI